MKMYNEKYKYISAEIIDRGDYYEVIIDCPNIRSESVREVAIIDRHLRIHMGYALIKYRHQEVEIATRPSTTTKRRREDNQLEDKERSCKCKCGLCLRGKPESNFREGA